MAPRALFTADYELFLGENLASEHEVLIAPTDALLGACDELGVPLTVFADVACLWRYREADGAAFPDAAEAQLRDAVRRGHDVQAHVHPHWAHATQENGRWSAPLDTFLVGLMGEPVPLLRAAKSYLETLLRTVDPAYACVAFRAGNYGIQPAHHRVFAALRESGYAIDSSVVPGLVLRNAVNQVDFRGFPQRDGMLDGIYEIPIASGRLGPLAAVGRRLRRRTPGGVPLGRTIQEHSGVRPSLRSRLFRHAMLELGPDARTLRLVTERHVRAAGDGATFALSSHPKTAGPRELHALHEYHAWLTGEFGAEVVRLADLVPARAAAA